MIDASPRTIVRADAPRAALAGLVQACRSAASSSELEGSARELERFREDLDRIFGLLVGSLGGASSQMTALLRHVESFRTTGRTSFVQVAVAATQEMVATFRAETRAVGQFNARLTAEVASVAAAEARVSRVIARLVGLSHWLRIAGLNCSTLVARAGALETGGFSALSRELSGRAAAILAGAARVEATFVRLHDAAASIARLSELLGQASHDDASVNAPIGELFEVLDTMFGSLGAVVDRVRSGQDAIGRIMLVVQRQDILRQELEHVGLALQELDDDASALDGPVAREPGDLAAALSTHLVFQERVGRLSSALLESCRSDLLGLVDETGAAVAGLSATASLLSRMREEFRGLVERRLGAPVRALGAVHATFEAHLRSCAGCLHGAREMQTLTQSLRREFAEIEEAMRAIRVTSTMMRVEIVRSKGLEAARPILEELGGKTRELEDMLAEGGAGLQALAAGIDRTTETLDGIEASNRRFAGVGEQIRGHPATVMGAGRTLELALAEIARLGDQTRDAVARADSDFAEFGRARVLERLQAATGAAAAAATALIERAREQELFVDPGEALRERLEQIVHRFTVFSQKEAGSAVTDVEVSQGDPGGTLTLF